jgi:hypothetical protein
MKTPHQNSPFLRLLFYVIASCISAHAQTPAVNVRFVSFPKAASPEPIELLIGVEKTMLVEIPTNSISKTYQVPVLSTWALGKSSRDEEGKFIFQAYGKGQSIGVEDQIILIIRTGQNDSDGLEITAIKSNDKGLSGGKYLMFNASKVDIAGTVGTAKFSLKPNKYELIAPEPTTTHEDRKYCFTKAYFRIGEEVQPFFSSTWRFSERARTMVFFYHDPNSKQLRIHTIRNYVE